MSMPLTSSCPPPSDRRQSDRMQPDRMQPDRRQSERWQAAAACAGLSPRVVFSKKPKVAAPALRACAGCPVRRDCEETVAPAENWFDGVCGGRLWRSGRPVPVPAHLLPPALAAVVDALPSKHRGGPRG
ncbi:WhiB family transcriptional regulator [Streptomyces sp. NPDC049687]|uniref:WhiB family transcriptional regulator n=1 Tax=Streptomyces sp. NPDC049687 TaxID=3365596 RepID=UPI00379A0024